MGQVSVQEPEQKWFIHLSDIHFRKRKADDYDPYDLDEDLRDQLELDVARVRARIDAPFYGIILSGDITFGGTEPEFEWALNWLRKLSDICSCPPENVFCVPGNHDADRSVFNDSLNLKNLHNSLRPAQSEHLDALLAEALRDTDAAGTLFRPLVQYNRFAARFRCPTLATSPMWEHRIPLNDTSSLVLRGGNSVLVSDWSDDNKSRKLILGSLQCTARQRADEAVVFICHHPLDWILDYDQVTPILNSRARVQLFGHKHLQVIDVTNNSLRMVAGAVHPDRREPRWRPRYNCLGFSVVGSGAGRQLAVEIYPRVWSEDEPKFIPDYGRCDGTECKTFFLTLEAWEPPRPSAPATGSEQARENAVVVGGDAMDPARTLTYRFLSLSHVVRLQIAQEMKLLREEDEGLFDAALFERILARASSEHRLAELWDLVETRHESKSAKNPYASEK